MKIPETYEEYLKTPKSYLKNLIEGDNLLFDGMTSLYTFNNQTIEEDSHVQKNTLWEELYEDMKDGL